MSNKSRGAKQERLRQIAQMRRAHCAESDWSTLLGEAARPLGVRPLAPPLPNLSDPALYLDSCGQAPSYAVSPHKSRRPLAVGTDVNSQTKDLECICDQICVGALHPQWTRRSKNDHWGFSLPI